MRCLAVCQDELVIRMLDEILLPGFEVEFIVEKRPLARRLQENDVTVTVGDPRRTETWVKADLGPSTCAIIEDNGRRNPRKILEAVRDAGGTLVYVLGIGSGATAKRAEEFHAEFPDVCYLSMSELFGGPLLTEFSRSLTRARVQQYQRYFSDADRVLIMLHNDPDPDAMASGLALRNILRRTKATAIIGAIQGVSRPENLRMVNLLDLHVEPITPASLREYDRIAMVDVQPHYFGGLIDRVDLVIDHHPEQPGYTAVFRDIRADYGSTCTILTEHLRAVDGNISERTATAMLYAIKSDTLFFSRQTNRVDLEAFSYLYPLADAALIRKMEGAEITQERLEYVLKAHRSGTLADQVFCAFLGPSPREDFIPYVADFFLQVEDVKWTVIAGIVGDSLVVSVRNLGYSKNAGEFVRRFFSDIGSAGGHRAMAKAVVPMRAFRQKFGDLAGEDISARLQALVRDFLTHETKEKEVRSSKFEVRSSEKPEAEAVKSR
jgi:nanoRNase/pAp phosphatase (c-di-AMP/oligoRNAs hydrolase)